QWEMRPAIALGEGTTSSVMADDPFFFRLRVVFAGGGAEAGSVGFSGRTAPLDTACAGHTAFSFLVRLSKGSGRRIPPLTAPCVRQRDRQRTTSRRRGAGVRAHRRRSC